MSSLTTEKADNSVELFHEAFPSIRIIETGMNLGFSGGFNKGIKYALSEGAEYVFMINNDTELPPAMIDTLLSAAEDLNANICSPLIYYGNDPESDLVCGRVFLQITLSPPECTPPGQTSAS